MCCISIGQLRAQNSELDAEAYKNWNSLGSQTLLTGNGKYVVYSIGNKQSKNISMIIQSTSGKIKKEFFGNIRDQQLADDNTLVFIKGGDSLAIYFISKNTVEYIPNISYFSLSSYQNGPWIAYKNKSNQFILCNLKTGSKSVSLDVERAQFVNEGDYLILWKYSKNAKGELTLNLMNMRDKKTVKVSEDRGIVDILVDGSRNQMVYRIGDSVWYYRIGYLRPRCIFNFKNANQKYTGSFAHFSKDGRRLFVSLEEAGDSISTPKDVEIWTYTDFMLPPKQETVAKFKKKFFASIDIVNQTMAVIDQESNISFPEAKTAPDSLVLTCKTSSDEVWSLNYKVNWSLISTITGMKKRLGFLDNKANVKISPYGKFLIYFDPEKQNYFSYEIRTGILRNITDGLQVSWIDLHRDDRSKTLRELNVKSVWGKYDEFVFIHDRFDIWKINPLNSRARSNITNGYGARNNVIFNFALNYYSETGIGEGEKIYLSAFDSENKDNGFYEKDLNRTDDPVMLFMGPYIFCSNSRYVLPSADFTPIKAGSSNCYIVRRMSANQAPNYFSTHDFKNFLKLSKLSPEEDYNWYTTELHEWKSTDGAKLQGILYKPKNFDPAKKYPVIFNYYERKSDRLNMFFRPEVLCDGCVIDIPTYVSQGYLVFTPDIRYKIGNPMEGTLNSVVSAANYIRNLSFVDSHKMGLMGCSFGGLQTNYLVTQTNLFASAVTASGMADLVSAYGGIVEGGTSAQDYFEYGGQGRMGGSLWERPANYISNSPLFQAHHVTTPLLMMHTKNDGIYPFSNAVEFFTGLRRLGKKVWMLVYSEGNHGVHGKEAVDFAARMKQFFDFYLKDKPSPIWMINENPSQNKSWRSGTQLDSMRRSPGPGLLKPEEMEKITSWMIRKPISVTLK